MPGKKKMGAKIMTTLILVNMVRVTETSARNPYASGPSIMRMSWVHRAIIRAAGVSSSHLFFLSIEHLAVLKLGTDSPESTREHRSD